MSDSKLGKIEHHLFQQFIQDKCGAPRGEVMAGPQFGVDVSLVDLGGGRAMALTSDPLSLIPSLGLEESAWLSVHLMANDMATTGYAPQFGQFVLNLPATFSKSDFHTYWEHIHRMCKDIGMAITGGHTGFIEGQNSTIAGGGTFIAIGEKDRMRVSKHAQPGNSLLVTKQCALSSSAILAMSFPETVKDKAGAEVYEEGCRAFYRTSSLPDALAAVGENHEHDDITAMHDVTEGGVLGAIYELATASGNGVAVHNEKLPVGEVQQQICRVFDLDPRYCIGAGAMIITCRQGTAPAVIERLAAKGILCTEAGTITEKEQGIKLIEDGRETDMLYYEEDPYWAAFFNALKAGWK
ncbi:AIR synthase family protein [Roseivirga sp. BDSF3-8]|uniref:AIR synthase family protein n=1 Tax=Roseivirga sp. BDSF3-8 TaxID=3241598 RepID=UPI0035321E41